MLNRVRQERRRLMREVIHLQSSLCRLNVSLLNEEPMEVGTLTELQADLNALSKRLGALQALLTDKGQ
jgi:hypothetical protein